MIHHVNKYFAIRGYVRRLGQDLARRFDRRAFYSVEHVTQAVKRGGFSEEFIASAHAAFCNQEEFDAFYKLSGIANGYQDLRRTIARRYFSGRSTFDAETIISKYGRGEFGSGDFYESNIGAFGP